MSSENIEHVPVLLQETMSLLITEKNGIYVDGTLGDGGYTRSLLEHLGDEGRVLALDWDEDAVKFAEKWTPTYGSRVSVYHSDYCDIQKILTENGVSAVHGIVLDLGLSSRQLNDPVRGFSYRLNGPLDMRMDIRTSQSSMDLLNSASESELRRIFFTYGEEHRSAYLAKIIHRERTRKLIVTTFDLVALMKKYWRPRFFTKSASRIFQALRIAVNHELDNLEHFLNICWQWMISGGRIAILSYHSLEDRIVKTVFRQHENPCICPKEVPVCQCGRVPDAKIITRKVILPTPEEKTHNPRARSAKLRVAEKI